MGRSLRWRQRTLAFVPIALLVAAACGGAAAPPAASSAPSAKAAVTSAPAPTAAPSASPAPVPSAYVPTAGQGGAVTATEDLTFTGAISGSMTKATLISAFCGTFEKSDIWLNTGAITGDIGGTTYVFGLTVGPQGKAPGTFTTTKYFAVVSDPSKLIAVSLFSAVHTVNLVSLAGGTITVDAGGQSGTVSATLDDRANVPGVVSRPATKTVKVSGHWSCR